MTSQNAYPSKFAGRPAQRPANEPRQNQPAWGHAQPGHVQPGHVQQPVAWPPQAQPTGAREYASAAPSSSQPYPQWGDYGAALPPPQPTAAPMPSRGNSAYAPQFEPYAPPGRPAEPQTPFASNWANNGPNDTFGGPARRSPAHPQTHPQQPSFTEHQFREPELSAADWTEPRQANGQLADSYSQVGGGTELGFAQPVGGQLDQGYDDEEDEEDYEVEEEAPTRRRPFMVLAALAGAILVGGGLAYGFKKITRDSADGSPPLIKSEAVPSKTKPADAGGKQFPYADSKIMGRLGDGSAAAAAGTAADSASDNGAPRKVSTLVVNRDGSIQAPAAVPAAALSASSGGAADSSVSVPGLTLVDAFGAQKSAGSASSGAAAPSATAAAPKPSFKKVVVVPPPADDDSAATSKRSESAPVKVTKINGAKNSGQAVTGSLAERDDAPAPAPKKKKRIAKAETVTSDADDSAAAPATSSHGTGFVAVLASVPKSSSSRMDALKRFADLQQQYGGALAGKTPDVADASLAKGNYHRLIAGPPGSREEASSICSKLKTAGYSGCWVMSY